MGPHMLLLLVLGPAVAVQVVDAAVIIQWQTPFQQGQINTFVPVTGFVRTDDGCSPLAGFCNPVPQTSVGVWVQSGVGLVYSQPFKRQMPQHPSNVSMSTKVPTRPKTSHPPEAARDPPGTAIFVQTADDGSFTAYASSPDVGVSYISASVFYNDTYVDAATTTAVQWLPGYFITLAPADVTAPVGSSQTLTATLKLGDAPVPNRPITFSREDFPARLGAPPKAPQVLATDIGTYTTDQNGQAPVTITYDVQGVTFVLATYTDPSNNVWQSNFARVVWGPIPPPPPAAVDLSALASSVTVGNDNTITATVTSASNTLLPNVLVTFKITGPGKIVDNTPVGNTRSSTPVATQSVSVTTGPAGTASITLRSNIAGADAVVASVSGGSITSDPLVVSWVDPDFDIVKLAPVYQQTDEHTQAQLTATVLDSTSGRSVRGIRVCFDWRSALSDPYTTSPGYPAAMPEDDSSHFACCTTDKHGQAVVGLDCALPAVLAVIASARNSAGHLINSTTNIINWLDAKPSGYELSTKAAVAAFSGDPPVGLGYAPDLQATCLNEEPPEDEYSHKHRDQKLYKGLHSADDGELDQSLTVSLLEDRAEPLALGQGDYNWKSYFICPKYHRNHPAQCSESPHKGQHFENFLQNSLTPKFAGLCIFSLTNAMNNTFMCSSGCRTVNMQCSILSSADKCADCPLPPGLSFNATGFIRVFDALSCSPSYEPLARTVGQKPSAPRNFAHKAYSGVAATIEADVVSVSSQGYGDGLEGKLQGAKLFYVGGFTGGQPYKLPVDDHGNEYEIEAAAQLPFVTPGSFRLVARKQ